MAVENFPVSDRCLGSPIAFVILVETTEPIVSSDSELVTAPETQENSWRIGEHNVGDNVIPPALSEVRQSVLSRELDDLVKKVAKSAKYRHRGKGKTR